MPNQVPFNHGGFMATLRGRRKTVPADWYADIMAALEVGLGAAAATTKAVAQIAKGQPKWLVEARLHMGTKEVPGAKHNSKILGWVSALGGWFKDDETPWCGTFVGYCMKISGHPVPKNWFRAKDWAAWGQASPPRVGAIAVFGRQGGGHVGFVVGENSTNLYILGGNQSNAVNIMPIAKSRMIAMRWPAGVPLSDERLPQMTGGTVSRNEA